MVCDVWWITLNVFWFIAKWWTWSVKRWMSGVIFILGWTSALKNDNPRNHLDMKRGLENFISTNSTANYGFREFWAQDSTLMNKSYLWPSGSGGSSIRSGLICAINIYSLFSKSPTNLRIFDSTKPVLNIWKFITVDFRVC